MGGCPHDLLILFLPIRLCTTYSSSEAFLPRVAYGAEGEAMIEISDDLIYKSLRKMMQSAFSTGCNWVRCGSPKDQSTKAVPCAFYVPGGHAEYGEDAGSSSGFAALWSSIPWTPNPAGLIL